MEVSVTFFLSLTVPFPSFQVGKKIQQDRLDINDLLSTFTVVAQYWVVDMVLLLTDHSRKVYQSMGEGQKATIDGVKAGMLAYFNINKDTS